MDMPCAIGMVNGSDPQHVEAVKQAPMEASDHVATEVLAPTTSEERLYEYLDPCLWPGEFMFLLEQPVGPGNEHRTLREHSIHDSRW